MIMQNLVGILNRHGFKASYFEAPEAALDYLKAEINGVSVGMGGSITLKELGLYEILGENNTMHWHWQNAAPDTLAQAMLADVYISSANAVSMAGEIVNIDATGNRVASLAYGPNRKKVFYVVGTNKIVENLEQAVFRAKNTAAPLNAKRLNRKTPCAIKGDHCYKCNSPERICRTTSIVTRPPANCEAHVLIINGDYGY